MTQTVRGGLQHASNLQLRILSAVVLAAATLGLTWLGDGPFRVFAAAIAGCIFWEWTEMSRAAIDRRHLVIAWIMLAATLTVVVIGGSASMALSLLGVSAIVLLVDGYLQKMSAWGVAGLLYAALSGISLAYLRGDDSNGLVAVLFLFAIVWATDILAFFVGRAMGGPKLAPAISPGKTWSGAIGGTLAGTGAGVFAAWSAGSGRWAELAAVALAISVVSQSGDLFESWVKRCHGVKDSGALIPGHGGVMDRADGLVAAAVALFLIGMVANRADDPARGLFRSEPAGVPSGLAPEVMDSPGSSSHG